MRNALKACNLRSASKGFFIYDGVPALVLQSAKPLTFVGSAAMIFRCTWQAGREVPLHRDWRIKLMWANKPSGWRSKHQHSYNKAHND